MECIFPSCKTKATYTIPFCVTHAATECKLRVGRTTLFDTEGNRENFLALFVHDPDSDPTKPTFKPVIKERTSKNSFICSYVGEECVLTKESDGKEKLFYKYTKTYNRYGLDRYGERIAGPYELYNDHSGGYYDNMLLRSLACYANTIIGDTNHPQMIMCPKTKKKIRAEYNCILWPSDSAQKHGYYPTLQASKLLYHGDELLCRYTKEAACHQKNIRERCSVYTTDAHSGSVESLFDHVTNSNTVS